MTAAVEVIVPSSAAPALSLLEEQEPLLQSHALRSLNALADSFWPEISGAVDKIQELSENEAFKDRNLAAIVAAKVNFHLGSLDDALYYALSAGVLFNVDAETEFANTLRARCIDEYISKKKAQAGEAVPTPNGEKLASSSSDHAYVKQLESVVERVLDGCISKGEIREAIGVAIEARRLDKVEIAILQGCKTDEARMDALAYCFECAQNLISTRGYRATVLNLIASIHVEHFTPEKRNFIAVANCYAFVGNADGVAKILLSLIGDESTAGPNEDIMELMALQIAFDLVDNDAPFFATKVLSILPTPKAPVDNAPPAPPAPVDFTAAAEAPETVPMETDTPATVDGPAAPVVVPTALPVLSKKDRKLTKLRRVLRGEVTSELYLDFLCSKNKSDTYLLKKIKQALDSRSSVCHSALLFANAIAHSGTAIDIFLRENLDWLARATAWAKFSATSCLGVIHGRHTWAALNLLSPYLPSSAGSRGSSATAYSEGGALYALGLIAATGARDAKLTVEGSEPSTAKEYLLKALRAGEVTEVVKHGACLGLGLSTMASWDGGNEENDYFEELRTVLLSESAVASEAAGLGMGLIALGSGSEKVCDEMLAVARETDHEKITRGLGMGAALVCYGREDDAMPIIKQMLEDKDPILRYGAMYAIALAYVGTADNKAIRMLLHSAVSDVSDDVRRAAVIALGFVLIRHPKLLPNIVGLLAESCHAHVRYGAAMAIGIACMGTGMTVAVSMLERLTADASDFVRQGALIGLAMVMMHHTEDRSPRSGEMRKTFESTWSAKLEDVITRFGAVVASGVMDAGGRNGVVALMSATGHPRMSAIVGLAMFTQFWYWYPLVHFIGLSVKPAALICLNQEVKMPKMKVQCNASEELYAYVPVGPPEKQREMSSAPKAVLSVTAKHMAKRRVLKKKDTEDKEDEKMDTRTDEKNTANADSKGDEGADKTEEKTEDKDKEVNKGYTVLENPCRVLDAQEELMSWEVTGEPESRYKPVVEGRMRGIVMMRDQRPGEPEVIVEMQSVSQTATATARTTGGETVAVAAAGGEDDSGGEEVPMPEAFVYRDEEEKMEEDDSGDGEKKEDAPPTADTGKSTE